MKTMRPFRLVVLAGLIATLSACVDRERGLHETYTRTEGPDEFAVLPSKPLVIPEELAALPPPRPGAANRTDPTPRADAVAALGGVPNAGRGAPIPSADAALIAGTGRFGVNPNIRTELAQADAEFRARRPGLRLLTRNRYYTLYETFTLDAYTELERFRRAGILVPSAPPPPEGGQDGTLRGLFRR